MRSTAEQIVSALVTVFALFLGSWVGGLLTSASIATSCGEKGKWEQDSWLYDKPIVLECQLVKK